LIDNGMGRGEAEQRAERRQQKNNESGGGVRDAGEGKLDE
jgi:hypothetical protein